MASSADARVHRANVRREFLGGLHTETLLWHLPSQSRNGLQTSIAIANRLKEEAQEAQVFAPGDQPSNMGGSKKRLRRWHGF
jgi:CTP:molybdopterin cytidylyltransferase MocA